MATIIVTGSAGLIGSECVLFFADRGFNIVGVDNDLCAYFFGLAASTEWNSRLLKEKYGDRYRHYDLDIRNRPAMENLFQEYSSDIENGDPYGRATIARLGGNQSRGRFHRQCKRHVELVGVDAPLRPRRYLSIHLHEQGLWRPSQPTPSAGVRLSKGD